MASEPHFPYSIASTWGCFAHVQSHTAILPLQINVRISSHKPPQAQICRVHSSPFQAEVIVIPLSQEIAGKL